MIRATFLLLAVSTLSLATGPAAFGQSARQVVPIARYDLLSIAYRTIHSPGAGVIVADDNLLIAGLYTRHTFKEQLEFGYPETYHSIELMLERDIRRHQYLGFFKSESDRPVAGGLRTFRSAAVYGYEVLQLPRLSLVLGGGLAVSEFGIETPAGRSWAVLPVPLVRAAWDSPVLNATLDLVTGPNLHLIAAPERRLRATLDARFDRLRDRRDLLFEAALVYRFFAPEHAVGDAAGIAAGIKSDAYRFDREAADESLELQYYALFGTLDLTVLQVTAGHALNSRLRYGDSGRRRGVTEEGGDGWFFSVGALYPFGGGRSDDR